MADLDRTIPTTNTQPKRQRGDGRIFPRGSKLWCGFYVDSVEHRESAKTNDPIKAEKYLRARLKEVHLMNLNQPSRSSPSAIASAGLMIFWII